MTNHLAHFTRNISLGDREWSLPVFDASVSNIVLAVTLVIIDLVTLFGNGLVLLAFLVNRHLFLPFNMYIFNLAVTDFFVAITAMTFYTIDTLLGYWPFGYAMCCVWIFFDFAMTFASVFTVVAISIDRFWCVTWALHYKAHNNRTKTLVILAVVWTCVFVLWTPAFISDRLKQTDENICIWKPSENREFVIVVAIIGHYLPCFIMVFCYLKVLYVMKRQSTIVTTHHQRSLHEYRTQTGGNNPGTSHDVTKSGNTSAVSVISHSNQVDPSTGGNANVSRTQEQPSGDVTRSGNTSAVSAISHSNQVDPSTGGNTNVSRTQEQHSGVAMRRTLDRQSSAGTSRHSAYNQSRERRIFITLTYVLGSYLICWFPFYIAFDTFAWKPELIPSQLYTFFFWMTYINSMLNPLIYAYTSKDFRAAFVKTLRCLYRCKV